MTNSIDEKKDWQESGEKEIKENDKSKAEKYNHLSENKYQENVTKVSKNQNNWNHSWAAPNQIYLNDFFAIRDVVPGPFTSPRLVKVTPFVGNSNKEFKKVDRIRRGIPDAWSEYLTVNGLSSETDKSIIKKELTLSYDNIKVTDFVWNELGLPLTQGIPDPWKPILSENESDERTDICLCNPTKLIAPKLARCRILREINAKKVKNKPSKRECSKSSKNFPELWKERKNSKCEEKINRRYDQNLNNFLPRSNNQNKNDEILQEPNNVIQCDVSGKITLHNHQGKSFDGTGSFKFNFRQTGNFVSRGRQKGENHQYWPEFAHNVYNKFTQTFEPKKQLSKLKNIFHAKRNDKIEDFNKKGFKLISCKCSCPYFKVLGDELLADNLLDKITREDSKSYAGAKIKQKPNKLRSSISECKTNKNEKKHYSDKKIKKVKLTAKLFEEEITNNFEEENLHDENHCGCEIRNIENSISSGNNADVSVISRESRLENKGTYEKENLCIPCDKRLPRKISEDNGRNDLTSELSDNFPSRKTRGKYSGQKILKPEPAQSSNTERKQRSVSYASEVEIMAEDKLRTIKKKLERRKFSDKGKTFAEKRTKNGDIVIHNLSDNSDEELSVQKEDKKKLRESCDTGCQKRGGALEIEFLASDLKTDKLETRKNAWFEEEKSLDPINEPIKRRKATESLKKSREKCPKNENKCYVKYCYDLSKKLELES
ncbi:uncharacterized protein LOC117173024 isoform X2 [Belonocnema kinseyi]|uniref:uncharacterized protein LOC117173024 isoform X2 n=1 Tax=Belonocnema kinseyi TaxID=2817044 RepID=UPI00143D7A13|nr:uncharacterized protein LOC117173024 isoform X2 [Belonocnema kinseyi]